MQSDYNKYGKDKFKVEILEKIYNIEDSSSRERYWIEKLDSINNGYNMIRGGGGSVNFFFSY